VIDRQEEEIAAQERRWRLVTGQAGTEELDRSAIYLEILQNLFTEDELRDLCFSLSVDFEALPAASKPGKARELLTYCQRHNRLIGTKKRKGLYELIQGKRPYLFGER